MHFSHTHTHTHTHTTAADKIVVLGPNFGISTYSILVSVFTWLQISYLSRFNVKECIKYARYYYRELKRLPLKSYSPLKSNVDNGYVFFLSTLWYNANWNNNDEDLNSPRYKMMKIVNNIPSIRFEGGFVSHNNRNMQRGYKSSVEKYYDMIYPKRLTAKEYQQKLLKSYVVLNTPAVVGCHGWKLAEALAYGKAIVSLPLKNELPYPLEHGVNIHLVENTKESIEEALMYIYNNPNYRKKLELGARKYWEDYCSPRAALRLMKIIE